MADVVMTLWTVYDHPLDHPEHVVVRGHDLVRGAGSTVPRQEAFLFHTVDGARLWLSQEHPEASICLARSPNDDPNIVETWT